MRSAGHASLGPLRRRGRHVRDPHSVPCVNRHRAISMPRSEARMASSRLVIVQTRWRDVEPRRGPYRVVVFAVRPRILLIQASCGWRWHWYGRRRSRHAQRNEQRISATHQARRQGLRPEGRLGKARTDLTLGRDAWAGAWVAINPRVSGRNNHVVSRHGWQVRTCGAEARGTEAGVAVCSRRLTGTFVRAHASSLLDVFTVTSRTSRKTTFVWAPRPPCT